MPLAKASGQPHPSTRVMRLGAPYPWLPALGSCLNGRGGIAPPQSNARVDESVGHPSGGFRSSTSAVGGSLGQRPPGPVNWRKRKWVSLRKKAIALRVPSARVIRESRFVTGRVRTETGGAGCREEGWEDGWSEGEEAGMTLTDRHKTHVDRNKKRRLARKRLMLLKHKTNKRVLPLLSRPEMHIVQSFLIST